jgi:uncharacterized membrane protein YcaP (DUF421 family)
MWHDMFVIQIPVLEKVLRTVLVYLAIVILFRLAGKRDLATFNTFDFVVIFLLSNVVQNAIIGNDTSLSGGIIGAAVLVAINAAFNRWLAASSRASRLLEGSPPSSSKTGTSSRAHCGASRPAEIDQAIRVQNGDDVSDIGNGRMEPSGQLVLSLKPAEQSATKGDIAHLNARLDSIDAALAALTG